MKLLNNILIEIDNREPQLFKNYFVYNTINDNLNILFKNLEQGDIIFKRLDNEIKSEEILLLIERKSIDDLLASVKDNRYIEQIDRFNQIRNQLDNIKIIYILEGNKNNYGKDTTELKCLNSCIFSLLYKHNFEVIFTYDMNDSFNFINNLSIII